MSETSKSRSIAIVGNCQVTGLNAALQALLPKSRISRWHVGVHPVEPAETTFKRLREFDLIVTQMRDVDGPVLALSRLQETFPNVVFVPPVVFRGFQPDCIYLMRRGGGIIDGGLGGLHSAIIASAYCLGLPAQRVPRLFNAYVYRALGYLETFDVARETMLHTFREAGYELAPHLERWMRDDEPFMYTINHPRIVVLKTLAREAAVRAGLVSPDTKEPASVDDALANAVQWPAYPELVRRFGASGGTDFVRQRAAVQPGERRELPLSAFVDQCYARYSELPKEEVEGGLPPGVKERLERLFS